MGPTSAFNTARGRVKEKNLAQNPKVALAIMDPDNPYRYVQVRGRIAEVTETGADAHIDALSKKYTGQDKYRQPQARRGAGHLQDPPRARADHGVGGRCDRTRDRLEGIRGPDPPHRLLVADRAGRAHRPRRSERRGQDHALPHSRRGGGAGRRARAHRQRRERGLSGAGCREQRGADRAGGGAVGLRRGLAPRGAARAAGRRHGPPRGGPGAARPVRRGPAPLRSPGRVSPRGPGQDRSSAGSASSRRRSIVRSRSSPADGACGRRWHACSCSARTSCCSTSRPITWISSPSGGWRAFSPPTTAAWCSSPTTGTS